MSTMREVAQRAGVSPATVSRVINGQGGYSAPTQNRVEEAIRQLNYQPDSLARGLKTTKSHVIGLLARRVSDALASEIMAGVEQEARAQDYAVMLGRTGGDAELVKGYLRTMRNHRVAGAILISTTISPEHRAMWGTTRPLISVAITDKSGAPSVAVDDAKAGYDGTRRLLELGHRHIGLIAGDASSIHVGAARLHGYQQAMLQAGLQPLVVRGNYFYESGFKAAKSLLAEDPRLTAIFALSDEMAAGAVNALHSMGISVPDQISVLGFDDTATAKHCWPALSTVHQPLAEMGAIAVRKVLHARDLAPQIVAHKIVERQSTAEPPRRR